MIGQGIYRVYMILPDDEGGYKKLAGRFYIDESNTMRLLEDHADLESSLPPGPVTPILQKRIERMQHSPYFSIISEKNMEEGHHPGDIEELDLDPMGDWNG